jgi:hypothetical protein
MLKEKIKKILKFFPKFETLGEFSGQNAIHTST